MGQKSPVTGVRQDFVKKTLRSSSKGTTCDIWNAGLHQAACGIAGNRWPNRQHQARYENSFLANAKKKKRTEIKNPSPTCPTSPEVRRKSRPKFAICTVERIVAIAVLRCLPTGLENAFPTAISTWLCPCQFVAIVTYGSDNFNASR